MAQPPKDKRPRFDPAGSIERHRAWLCNATSRSSDAAGDDWSLMRAHVEDADPRTRGVARSLRWLLLGQLDRLQTPEAIAARATRDLVAEFRKWIEQAPGLAAQLEGWLAQAREHGDAVRAWQETDQPPANENIHPSLTCLTPERFEHVVEAVHFLKMVAAIPPGLVADPTVSGKRKDVLRYAIAELKNAGFPRAEDISPLIDDCYGDDDTSAAKLKRLREYLHPR